MNIVLIGFMGCGKTTTGKLLSEKLSMNFVDLDEYIEKNLNATITQLFSDKGEDHFRELEKKALAEVLKNEDTVIATGGGTPCFFENMKLINEQSLSVYLKLSADSIVERLNSEKNSRPLISSMNSLELRNFVKEQLEKRDPFYSKANYTVKAKEILIGALADFLKVNTLAERV